MKNNLIALLAIALMVSLFFTYKGCNSNQPLTPTQQLSDAFESIYKDGEISSDEKKTINELIEKYRFGNNKNDDPITATEFPLVHYPPGLFDTEAVVGNYYEVEKSIWQLLSYNNSPFTNVNHFKITTFFGQIREDVFITKQIEKMKRIYGETDYKNQFIGEIVEPITPQKIRDYYMNRGTVIMQITHIDTLVTNLAHTSRAGQRINTLFDVGRICPPNCPQ